MNKPTRLLAALFGLCLSSPLFAQALPFAGRWIVDDPAGAYTTLTVKGTTMSWSGQDKSVPPCVREFTVQEEKPGTVYLDARGTRFVAGAPGSLPSYLLKLAGDACGGTGDTVRIRYHLVYDVRHIEVIDYVGGKPASARRLHRAPEARKRKR